MTSSARTTACSLTEHVVCTTMREPQGSLNVTMHLFASPYIYNVKGQRSLGEGRWYGVSAIRQPSVKLPRPDEGSAQSSGLDFKIEERNTHLFNPQFPQRGQICTARFDYEPQQVACMFYLAHRLSAKTSVGERPVSLIILPAPRAPLVRITSRWLQEHGGVPTETHLFVGRAHILGMAELLDNAETRGLVIGLHTAAALNAHYKGEGSVLSWLLDPKSGFVSGVSGLSTEARDAYMNRTMWQSSARISLQDSHAFRILAPSVEWVDRYPDRSGLRIETLQPALPEPVQVDKIIDGKRVTTMTTTGGIKIKPRAARKGGV